MHFRRFLAACAALLLSGMLAEAIAAVYPLTARSGVTTVTGVYRPLDLNLSLKNGEEALYYCSDNNCSDPYLETALDYFATYSGTYTGTYNNGVSDYVVTGPTGDWELSFFGYDGAVASTLNTASLVSSGPLSQVGYLTYLGGGSFGGVPPEDTPSPGDYFRLYAPSAGEFLKVTCTTSMDACDAFTVELTQTLLHLGPFSYGDCTSDCMAELDTFRLNDKCVVNGQNVPCGEVLRGPVASSGVPEPASLALVGLGLVALALGRRQRQPRLWPA